MKKSCELGFDDGVFNIHQNVKWGLSEFDFGNFNEKNDDQRKRLLRRTGRVQVLSI